MTSAVAIMFLLMVAQRPVLAGAQIPDSLAVRGKLVYQEQRCRLCHSVGGDGNRRSPLDRVGSRLTGEDLRKWIVAPQEMKPGIRKRPYDKLSAADLNALVAYLKSLRSPSRTP
jgi:ubiquinol-cytochrome c reductase cytochrome b subunit